MRKFDKIIPSNQNKSFGLNSGIDKTSERIFLIGFSARRPDPQGA